MKFKKKRKGKEKKGKKRKGKANQQVEGVESVAKYF